LGKRGEIEIAKKRLLSPTRNPIGSRRRRKRKSPIPAKRKAYFKRIRRRIEAGEEEEEEGAKKELQLHTRRRKLREEKAAPRRTLQTNNHVFAKRRLPRQATPPRAIARSSADWTERKEDVMCEECLVQEHGGYAGKEWTRRSGPEKKREG